MARMEDAFDTLRRVVYRASGMLMGMERAEWDKRIDALYDRAMDGALRRRRPDVASRLQRGPERWG